jgi:hypothetical protein
MAPRHPKANLSLVSRTQVGKNRTMQVFFCHSAVVCAHNKILLPSSVRRTKSYCNYLYTGQDLDGSLLTEKLLLPSSVHRAKYYGGRMFVYTADEIISTVIWTYDKIYCVSPVDREKSYCRSVYTGKNSTTIVWTQGNISPTSNVTE